jgi:hypothetical protein
MHFPRYPIKILLLTSSTEPVRPAGQLEKLRFTGGLELDENKTLFRVIEPHQPQYAGSPSPQIDETWHSLMRGTTLFTAVIFSSRLILSPGLEIVVEGQEARTVKDKTLEEPEGNRYRLSLDMYHSLHCVVSIILLALLRGS